MQSEKKKEFIRALKFLLFSISAGVIEFGSFTLLDLTTDIIYPIKASISLLLSVIWNFTFNRKFTFKSANNVRVAMLKTLGYYVIFGPLSILFADMYLVQTLMWNELLVKACTMVVNFVTEFLFQRYFVYGKSVDSAVNAVNNREEDRPVE